MLNYQFSNAGHTPARGGVPFGDLVLCGFPAPSKWNGVIIRDFVITATQEVLLGARPPYLTIAEVHQMTVQLNASFSNGLPSQFAQDHLVAGSCAGAWMPGDMTSYSQFSWGTMASPAATILLNGFFGPYALNGVEIGIPGNAGNSMVFTEPEFVLNYLPECSTSMYLDKDYLDPPSTNSGCLGGATTALQIDVDFSDAGLLPASSGVRFGDLRICGVINIAASEGETVRALLARANQFLGSAVPDPTFGVYPDALAALVEDVTSGFELGVASPFAREHLVNGPCP
jgi:hypothetical protein